MMLLSTEQHHIIFIICCDTRTNLALFVGIRVYRVAAKQHVGIETF
jgi:hypothetical protein